MYAWLSTQIGADAALVVNYILLATALLIITWLCFSFARRGTRGIFVVMGKNRQMRLSVRDAAAVDSQRRIVLVRRDDVEHLILIGGPSDVVIECNITPPDVELRKQQGESIAIHKTATDQPVSARALTEKAVEKPAGENRGAEAFATEQQAVEKNTPVAEMAEEETPDNSLLASLKAKRDVPAIKEEEQNRILPPPAAETVFASHTPAPVATPSAPRQAQHYPQKSAVQPPHTGSRQASSPFSPASSNSAAPHLTGGQPHMPQSPAGQPINRPQPHLGYPAAVSASAKRFQPSPAQQETMNISAFTMRESKADASETTHGIATAPQGGTPGDFGSYQGYTPHHIPSTSTPPFVTPKKNTANGDLSDVNPGNHSPHASMGIRREPILDLSENNHEANFRNTALPEEEDFDKILQEELLRSQSTIKTASPNKT